MKSDKNGRLSKQGLRYCIFSGCLGLALIGQSAGQVSSSEKSEPSDQNYAIKIQVDETRIDAVALDRNGHQIKDLKAEDFELYQDGRRQEIKSCVYVNEDRRSSEGTFSRQVPLVSTPLLPREKVQRTIAFVIDNARMSLENFSNARMAVQKFIQSQMEYGDLVSIQKTSGGIGALQLFSTDKVGLMSRIKSMDCGTACWANSFPTVGWMMGKDYDPIVDASLSNRDLDMLRMWRSRAKPPIPESPFPQINAIRFCIRALRDMPGRKSLLFLSPQISYLSNVNLEQIFNQLADEALRAGVVVYAMDAKGLTTGIWGTVGRKYVPWPKKTGGIIVENTNFFLHGIGPVEEELKGYYLLSYIPPEGTFETNRRNLYHRIRIKVNRPGSVIHNRDGFFGVADRPDSVPDPRMNTLQQAIYSPFLYNDLTLALASGYAHAPASGYFLSSRLHLDGKNLVFGEEQSGRHSFSLELETLTSNANSVVEDSKNMKYVFEVKTEDLPYIKKYGIDLSLNLPVKKPGAYYVRAAIKDRNSGKIGSAYQFIEIPDLQKRRPTLSSIFAFRHEDDIAPILSGEKKNSGASSLPPQDWEVSDKSLALRVYHPGEEFQYLALLYNANLYGVKPELESQVTVFKDGKEFYKGNPETVVDLHGITDLEGIPIRGKVAMGSQWDPGAYVLQLRVSEKQSKGNSRTAVQAIDFGVIKDNSREAAN